MERVLAVKKWLAFLKWYGCVYLGVDIIMFLWYSSCWVWNASVSKARRRSQTKAWIKVRISVPPTDGSWESNGFVFNLWFSYSTRHMLFSLWITVCEYIFYSPQNIRNGWFLWLGFALAGRSSLQAPGSPVKMAFNYKALISAAVNPSNPSPCLSEFTEYRAHTHPPALPVQCLCLLHLTCFFALCRAQQRFLHEDWNVFI